MKGLCFLVAVADIFGVESTTRCVCDDLACATCSQYVEQPVQHCRPEACTSLHLLESFDMLDIHVAASIYQEVL